MNELQVADKVVLIDVTNLDLGFEVGLEGTINSKMEDPEGNRFIMFQPKGKLAFYWMAEWRVRAIAPEDMA